MARYVLLRFISAATQWEIKWALQEFDTNRLVAGKQDDDIGPAEPIVFTSVKDARDYVREFDPDGSIEWEGNLF